MKSLTLLEQTLSAMEEKYGVYLVIKDMYSFMQTNSAIANLLRRFFVHENPYCLHVKGCGSAIAECTRFEHTEMGRQMNSNPELYRNGRFVTCNFGVREFYYPIKYSGHIIGALVLGCQQCEKDEFADRASIMKNCGVNPDEAIDVYKKHIVPCKMPETEVFFREVALYGEMLSIICDKLLYGIGIEEFFKYNFILNDTSFYLDLSENSPEKRMISKNLLGENHTITIILNAISYIHNNYSQNITIEKIARYCYCSSSTLSHVFAKNYGMTIVKLIHTVRCDRAKALLKESNLSLSQIAVECGFSSRDYFNTVFKKIFGITPTEYRTDTSKKG